MGCIAFQFSDRGCKAASGVYTVVRAHNIHTMDCIGKAAAWSCHSLPGAEASLGSTPFQKTHC